MCSALLTMVGGENNSCSESLVAGVSTNWNEIIIRSVIIYDHYLKGVCLTTLVRNSRNLMMASRRNPVSAVVFGILLT